MSSLDSLLKPSKKISIMSVQVPHYRSALITGASSGLGLEFARQLAPHCETLILVARREAVLEENAKVLLASHPGLKVKILACDLGQASAREGLLASLSEQELWPDLLINNAGMGDYGEFRSSDWEKTSDMIRLNMEALTHLTHALLPRIIAYRGAIINVSSLASTLPIPDFAVYAATKAYVTSLSEALRIELADHDVQVLAVCPGPVKTGFGDRAMRGSRKDMPVKKAFYVSQEQVVSESIRGLLRKRARVYPGLKVAAAAIGIGILPLAAVRLIMSFRPRKS